MRDLYLVFTDECGSYKKNCSERAIKAHPFYVRSNIIIPYSEYDEIEEKMDEIKRGLNISSNIEIKLSHYGNALKKNYDKFCYNLDVNGFE